MSQKSLSNWLKVIIILMAVCGLVVYMYIFPNLILRFMPYSQNGENLSIFNNWMIILWISAIPCYMVLVFGWLISKNIGNDKSFTIENAKYLKYIMVITLVDCIYYFIANIIMFYMKANNETIMIFSLVAIFAGIVFAVAIACLSHLVLKAAKLQTENELTI